MKLCFTGIAGILAGFYMTWEFPAGRDASDPGVYKITEQLPPPRMRKLKVINTHIRGRSTGASIKSLRNMIMSSFGQTARQSTAEATVRTQMRDFP